MAKRHNIWRGSANPEDFAAAESYLTLFCSSQQAKRVVRQLRRRSTRQYQAKDLLRASGLPLLPHDESHVEEDLKRIQKGKTLSPVLLVRGNLRLGRPLVIADGYHRICAVYYFDEDAPIACRMAVA